MTPERIQDALKLEKLELTRSLAAAARKAEVQIAQSVNRLGAMSRSGNRYVLEENIRFEKSAEAIESAIEQRKRRGQRIPELLSPQSLIELQGRLEQQIEYIVNGVRQRLAIMGTGRTGVSGTIIRQIQMRADSLKGKIRQDLELLRLEASIGMHDDDRPTSLNISHSIVANVNLGTVVGDLNASVQVLQDHGQKDLASQIQKLAEAIGSSTELQEQQRADLLQYLSAVSTEVALPPEKRKPAPFKLTLSALKSGLETVAQLSALWPPLEHTLKSIGILR